MSPRSSQQKPWYRRLDDCTQDLLRNTHLALRALGGVMPEQLQPPPPAYFCNCGHVGGPELSTRAVPRPCSWQQAECQVESQAESRVSEWEGFESKTALWAAGSFSPLAFKISKSSSPSVSRPGSLSVGQPPSQTDSHVLLHAY